MNLTPEIILEQAYLYCERNTIKNLCSDKKCTADKKQFNNFIVRNNSICERKEQFMSPPRAQLL